MNKLNKNCEMCSMEATHTEQDAKILNHFFCEHHSLQSVQNKSQVKNNYSKLKPLFYVFGLIITLSAVRQFANGIDLMVFMMDFMGIFFLTFGLFKLYDLEGFVEGFKTYDIVAKRWNTFGYIFPFIEIILGAMYLAGFMFFYQNMIALILALIGMYSAYVSIKNKEEIQCLCLGTAFNLPMTNVTLIENGIMFIMVLFMLVM